MIDKYLPGMQCTINGYGDIYLYRAARKFINAPCVIVKRTRAGLIQVALCDDSKQTFSFSQRNVDLHEEESF